MKKTSHKKDKSKHRKTHKRRLHRRIRGGDDELIKAAQYEEARGYEKVIDQYIKNQESNAVDRDSLSSLKYMAMKDKFERFKNEVQSKVPSITNDELDYMRNVVFFIIKDDADTTGLIYDKNAAGFQNVINNIIMYFINDIEVEDNVVLNFRKRISNGKPYLDVLHSKTGLETSYDVNEIFALIKNELTTGSIHKIPEIIKSTKLKNKRTVENI
jgi:hypothetical protein